MINLHNRKLQVGLATLLIYGLTIFTMITTLNQSHSFLQWSIKMTKGVNFIILSLFILLNTLLSWQLFTTLLFGELRLIEQEHIFERLPFTVISIIMVTSSFNDKQILSIVLLAAILLVLRVSHWILKDRLESLLQHINNDTRLIHLIFSNFTRNMIIFAIIDYFATTKFYFKKIYSFYQLRDWNNILIITFGIEFASIAIDYLNVFFYTILNFYAFQKTQLTTVNISIDNLNDGSDMENDSDDEDANNDEFENKFFYEKVIDLFTRFFKLLLHLSFLIPLNFQSVFFKDLIWDVIILSQSANSLFKIYKNNKKLEDKLPTITIWDLKNHDNTCIVCMDDLVKLSHERRHEIKVKKSVGTDKNADDNSNESVHIDENEEITQADIDNSRKHKMPKILPCGHMLHFSCLKNWMERSQTCPICRVAVFDQNGNVRPIKHQEPPTDVTETSERHSSSSIPSPTRTHPSNSSNAINSSQTALENDNSERHYGGSTEDNGNNDDNDERLQNSINNDGTNMYDENLASETDDNVVVSNVIDKGEIVIEKNEIYVHKRNNWYMFSRMTKQKDKIFFKIKNKDIDGKNVLASLEIKENDNIQDGKKIVISDELIHRVKTTNSQKTNKE